MNTSDNPENFQPWGCQGCWGGGDGGVEYVTMDY